VLRSGNHPDGDDGLDHRITCLHPRAPMRRSAAGKGALPFGEHLGHEVPGHRHSLATLLDAQGRDTRTESGVELSQLRRHGQRLLHDDRAELRVGHDLTREPRVPRWNTEILQVLRHRSNQAPDPVVQVERPGNVCQRSGSQHVDRRGMPPGDLRHEVGPHPEVVIDGSRVPLTGCCGDVPVRHRVEPPLGEEPLCGIEQRLPSSRDLLRSSQRVLPKIVALRTCRRSSVAVDFGGVLDLTF
jgi:hypothetical protein